MWKYWWDSSVWIEYVWGTELLYSKLENAVDLLQVLEVFITLWMYWIYSRFHYFTVQY